jgi:hypothetical protein
VARRTTLPDDIRRAVPDHGNPPGNGRIDVRELRGKKPGGVTVPLTALRMLPRCKEAIFRPRRKGPETKAAYPPHQSNNGDRHVNHHPERDLPRIPHRHPSRHRPPRGNPMSETFTALSVFFSISVFLAHAFDAYRMR